MLRDLRKVVEGGMLNLSDPDLIAELRSYTRDDLIDRDEDVRLTTRHFDLLIAAANAWQMRSFATLVPARSGPQRQHPRAAVAGFQGLLAGPTRNDRRGARVLPVQTQEPLA
jgi:hypothetical protein